MTIISKELRSVKIREVNSSNSINIQSAEISVTKLKNGLTRWSVSLTFPYKDYCPSDLIDPDKGDFYFEGIDENGIIYQGKCVRKELNINQEVSCLLVGAGPISPDPFT